jgi:ATP-dependent helicase HrpB
LHGSLPLEEQERALRASPDGFKKIIFSTNIAETSLTIEGVTCVIDSGLEKILTFTPSSGMSNLKTTRISKASAQQRTGRAGRLSAGSCIRLWSQSEHASLKSYQQEEILNADLAAMVLELARSGHVKYENINWLTPPPKAHFDSAQDLLKRLELLEPSGKISTIGEKASQLPVHPRLAKMMLSAQDAQERELACIISGILSHQDLLRKADSVDLLMRIFLVIEGNQNNLKNKPYMFRALSKDIVRLKAALKHQSVTVSPATINNVVAYLVLQAFPERLAKKRSASSNTYQLANGKGVFLDKSDPLSNDQFLVVNDCDADQKDGRIYSAVCFDINILYERYADKIEEIQEYKLSTKTNEVYVSKLTKYGSILLAQRRSDDVPKKFLFDSIKSLLKEDAKRIVDWTWQCEEWLKRVVWLGGKVTGFPILTQASIMDTADEWLLPYLSNTKKVSDLKRVKIFPFLTSLLTYEESKILEQEAPVTYTTPNNKKITINYDKHQGPTVCVVLQEVFGEKASPRLGGGTVALRFELLSPAKRPIQITSDLANFWTGSYFDVAKEMRAKYPKHRWPVDPLCEEAGTSIKKR